MTTGSLQVLIAVGLLAAVPWVEAQSAAGDEAARRAEEKARAKAEQQLREAERQMREAERQMREAERQMREAERQMRDAAREAGRHAGEYAAQAMKKAMVVFEDRPRIGVILRSDRDPATDAIGAEIIGVTPGGPADEAGMRVGDVIVRVNGERVAAPGDPGQGGKKSPSPAGRLQELVGGLDEDEAAVIEIRRGNETKTLSVTPRRMGGPLVGTWHGLKHEAELKRLQEELSREIAPRAQRFMTLWRDLELTALTPELGEYFGATDGVLVTRAPGDGSLHLKAGDVILKVNGRPAGSPVSVLSSLAGRSGGDTVNLEVLRKGKLISVDVEAADLSRPSPPEHPASPAPPAPPARPQGGQSM